MKFSVIAACDYLSGGIGYKGELSWKIKPDLEFFKRKTSGGTVIMGRRTWESIGSNPLPNRKNIVVSSSLPGSVATLDEALGAADFGAVFVIGGEELYTEALAHPDCERVYLTFVRPPSTLLYDAFFPLEKLNGNGWKLCHMTDWMIYNNHKYIFTEHCRI